VNVVCELCGKPMAVRTSKHGPFLGCTGYPDCKSIRKIENTGKKNLYIPSGLVTKLIFF